MIHIFKNKNVLFDSIGCFGLSTDVIGLTGFIRMLSISGSGSLLTERHHIVDGNSADRDLGWFHEEYNY